ncbi:MAG: hypothetical protein DI570_02855 [Phenylobacterium zucineum]|nr:MAG: hypothetical protein DI570_02855 [Phenylobacterium zucineum]
MRHFVLIAAATTLLAAPAFAQDSGREGSQASTAASEAVGHLAASGVKTAVCVAAVPVSAAAVGTSVVGAGAVSVGAASVKTGAGLSVAAKGGATDVSLKVDDDVVIAADPAPKVPYQPAKK